MGERPIFRYRADVLERLWRHGVQPTIHTAPELVRAFVRDLYRYEIRQLRASMLRGDFPKTEYLDRVAALRDRYIVLALLPRQMVE
jgi:hypothetical protein